MYNYNSLKDLISLEIFWLLGVCCGVGVIAPRLLTACFIDSGGCPNAVKTLATFGLSNVAKAFVKDSVPPFSLTAFIKPSLELP